MDVREKLIDLIIDAKRTDPEVGSFTEYLADHLIAHGVTVQEWVSVDDRLPKDWTDVLVSSRFGFLETAVYTGTPGKWRIGWNGDMLEADSITHWMPIPQPPKGDNMQ